MGYISETSLPKFVGKQQNTQKPKPEFTIFHSQDKHWEFMLLEFGDISTLYFVNYSLWISLFGANFHFSGDK